MCLSDASVRRQYMLYIQLQISYRPYDIFHLAYYEGVP